VVDGSRYINLNMIWHNLMDSTTTKNEKIFSFAKLKVERLGLVGDLFV
jgi:hypothetical protein